LSLITSTRARINDVINQNPTTITITRTTKSSDGAGGYSTSTSTLSAQTVRIYRKKTRVLNVDEGGWHSSVITKMLAKYDADVQEKTATNTDSFTYDGNTYEVKHVENRYINGSIVKKTCEIEKV